MCVTAWGSVDTPEGPCPLQDGIEIVHFEEAMFCGTDCHEIEILASVLVRVTVPRAFIHLVHRRWVTMKDATESILDPVRLFDHTLSAVSPAALVSQPDPRILVEWSPPLGTTDDLPGVLKVRPIKVQLAEQLTVLDDMPMEGRQKPQDREHIPYTSVSFGPFFASESLSLWRARIRVTDPSFSQLIRQVNAYGVQYHHGIEGPKIVWRDIEQLDIDRSENGVVSPFIQKYSGATLNSTNR